MPEISRVGVVGCGQMGAGIAEVIARRGLDVVVVESDRPALDAGRRRIEQSLRRAVEAGRLLEDDMGSALAAIRYQLELDALADRQLVIEAVPELADVKFAVFQRLDGVLGEDAILASNTSSIPIMRLGTVTRRPDRIVGLHFFNPVPVLNLVELVTSLMTSTQTVTCTEDFVRQRLGKQVIRAQDRAGFVVNALLIPYLLSAIRMLESGFATAEDIDLGMVEGCAHPMGPLRLTDLIGLDTTLRVAESLYEEFREQLYSPPPLLQRMVDAGLLGRKSGRGFFGYASTTTGRQIA
jgi:3-hydroxybutyryl-CoA dehydrogenase